MTAVIAVKAVMAVTYFISVIAVKASIHVIVVIPMLTEIYGCCDREGLENNCFATPPSSPTK